MAYWGGVNSVSATKTNWSPSTWVATWTSGTKTMSWNGSDGYKVMHTGLELGDLASKYTKIRVDITSITGDNDYIQMKVVSTGKSEQLINLTTGVNNIIFADYSSVINFSDVTEITLWGTGSSDGSAVITDCYLYNPVKTITVATGFGDEITSMDYITEGNKFVISNGTNALYFEGNQDAKDAAVQSVPSTSYYYYTLTEIKLDLNSDEALETYYAINIVNEAGTAFPAPYSLGNCLNFTGNPADAGNALFSGSCQSDKAQGYGTDCQYKGLWEITYLADNGFALRNVGANKYAIVRGNSADPIYLKLYKSIVFSSSTDLEKENNAANDAIFAFTNATGYNAETGELTNGTWTFGTPVDLSDWDYLMITTINSGGGSSHEIIIKDVNDVTVQGEGYSGIEAGTGKNMWLDTWNNQNAIRISLDYLRKNKSMDISQIKSLKINGTVKVANVYLTDYNNTKINGGYCTGDVVREYAAIDKFGTICLPYKASCAGAEIFEIAGKTASSVTLAKVTGLLEAGKPYFYLASDAVGEYEWGTAKNIYNVNFFRADADTYDAASAGTNNGLIGTFSEITAPTGANYCVLSNNKLYNVDSSVTVGANKAYVDISAITPSLARGVVDLDFNEPTGIETVANSQEVNANSKFFNLAGQRVAQPTKGLYIVNGKKVLVK